MSEAKSMVLRQILLPGPLAAALASLRKIWANMERTDAQEISETINQAVQSTREAEK